MKKRRDRERDTQTENSEFILQPVLVGLQGVSK
jgi:hypothetical protein